MLKKGLLLGLILLTLLFAFSLLKLDIVKQTTTYESKELKKEKPIGILKIDKIHLNEEIYPINSYSNTIQLHVTILKESIAPTEENSIFFLAAHSGTGKIAFFEELDELEVKDEITLIYKDYPYHYLVTEIYEEPKNGYIHVSKAEKKQLVLTTCHPTNKNTQLIINSIEKESN